MLLHWRHLRDLGRPDRTSCLPDRRRVPVRLPHRDGRPRLALGQNRVREEQARNVHEEILRKRYFPSRLSMCIAPSTQTRVWT